MSEELRKEFEEWYCKYYWNFTDYESKFQIVVEFKDNKYSHFDIQLAWAAYQAASAAKQAEIDELRKELDTIKDTWTSPDELRIDYLQVIENYEKSNDKLRAELDNVNKQEPVRYLFRYGNQLLDQPLSSDDETIAVYLKPFSTKEVDELRNQVRHLQTENECLSSSCKAVTENCDELRKQVALLREAFVGNDVMWWAKNGAGYTTDLSKAHVYTQEESQRQHNCRETDIPWPKHYIDTRTRPAVDMQYIKRDEALAGTGVVLQKPVKHRKEQIKCGECGRFLSEAQLWDGTCPECGCDNRP